ncbi:MAG: DUF4145 domain-containing protein [Acidobacteria bacterium]|nr:DUF4145 domain-containing protein [Acidobacteriota bacterium]
MYKLEVTNVPEKAWSDLNGLFHPTSINTYCPHCGKSVNFNLIKPLCDSMRNTVSSTGNCPNCLARVHFWFINPSTVKDSTNRTCEFIGMFPALMKQRKPIEGANLIPERIYKAYIESLNTYNAGLWGPTTTCCRRTLEGIIKALLPASEATGTLYNQLTKLTKHVDLAKPLITLSNTLREGGNLGAHFDDVIDVDEDTARATLELIEYLLEYTYALPEMIKELEIRINKLNTANIP